MNDRKKSRIMIVAYVIIIVSFFYSTNFQTVVIGDSSCFKSYASLDNLDYKNDQANFLKNRSNYFYHRFFTSVERLRLVISNNINAEYNNEIFNSNKIDNPKMVSRNCN
jgi:hypothetical protein